MVTSNNHVRHGSPLNGAGGGGVEESASEVRFYYAKILQWVALIGLIFLVITFCLYIFGLLPSLVEPEKVTRMWDMEAEEYIEANDLPTGWAWVRHLDKGDILTFASLIFLASGTIICFIPTFFLFLKKRDRIYALFVLLEIGVLLLAATGILTGGH